MGETCKQEEERGSECNIKGDKNITETQKERERLKHRGYDMTDSHTEDMTL